ncbi:MAG TPA: cytochrome b/b6 domain-containing protein [Burkholderiaceae bacterium]|nr:cytochrome b/b6 domain-containing protein [Burkholderiaceae bacterium]
MAASLRIWDLPTRLFHWALVVLVGFSVVTVKLGGLWMDWHMRSGYAILALVLFRILWGFAGSRYALFSSFVRRPSEIIGYLRGRIEHGAGHSPLAAVSVLALLGLLLLQAGTGLFSNDGNFTEGPLARLASRATSEQLSTVHRLGEWAIYTLVGLHIAAIAYYTTFRKVALVRPMFTGDRLDVDGPSADDGLGMRLRALTLAVAAAALTTFIVTL